MKPWNTSSARNETRSAALLFALIRNGLAMGQNYRGARRENGKPPLTPRSRRVTKRDLRRKTTQGRVLPSSEFSDSLTKKFILALRWAQLACLGVSSIV